MPNPENKKMTILGKHLNAHLAVNMIQVIPVSFTLWELYFY